MFGGENANLEAVLNLSPKAHTKTDTSSQEKLFGEIQNSLYFAWYGIVYSGRQTLPLQVNWQDAEFMKN